MCLVFSWDSLDLSSEASRRFYIPPSVPIRARWWWKIFLLALSGQISQLSKPSVSVFSWDSLDISSEASRRLEISSAFPCQSVRVRGGKYFSLPCGQISQLSKPSVSVFSWDSLDISSEASRRLEISSAVPCLSVLVCGGRYSPLPCLGRYLSYLNQVSPFLVGIV